MKPSHAIAAILFISIISAIPLSPAQDMQAWGAVYSVRLSGEELLSKPVKIVALGGNAYAILDVQKGLTGPKGYIVLNITGGGRTLYYLYAGNSSITPLALAETPEGLLVASSFESNFIYHAVIIDSGETHAFTIPGQQPGYRVVELDSADIGRGAVVYGGSDTGDPFILLVNTSTWNATAYTIESPTGAESEKLIAVKMGDNIVIAMGLVVWSIYDWVGASLAAFTPDGRIISYITLSTGDKSILEPAAMAILSDGRIVIGGYANTSKGGLYDQSDAWTAILRLAENGFQLEKTYFLGTNEADEVTAILPLSNGGFIAVGNTRIDGGKIFLVEFDSNGNPVEVELLTQPGTEGALTAGIEDGTIYIGDAYIDFEFVGGSYIPIAAPIILFIPLGVQVNLSWSECPAWGCPHQVESTLYPSLESAGLSLETGNLTVNEYAPVVYPQRVEAINVTVTDRSGEITIEPYIATNMPTQPSTSTSTTYTSTAQQHTVSESKTGATASHVPTSTSQAAHKQEAATTNVVKEKNASTTIIAAVGAIIVVLIITVILLRK